MKKCFSFIWNFIIMVHAQTYLRDTKDKIDEKDR